MKKAQKFVWDEVCEQSFQALKEYLSSPSVLQKPSKGKSLLVYLAISTNAISGAIVQDQEGYQRPVYFISKVILTIEKVILTLVITTTLDRPIVTLMDINTTEVVVPEDEKWMATIMLYSMAIEVEKTTLSCIKRLLNSCWLAKNCIDEAFPTLY